MTSAPWNEPSASNSASPRRNVLVGEMSLVGPRPFASYHNQRFHAEFRDLDAQTQLDTYYIKNWSIWLGLYILTRTARAVLFPTGAY